LEMEMTPPEDSRPLLIGSTIGSEHKTHYQCTRCTKPLQLSETLLTQGCPFCGAKTFRFTTPEEKEAVTSRSTHVNHFEEDSPDIIRLVQPGIYQINLSKLTGRNNSNEPLVLSAKSGIFRISFPTND